MKFGKVLSIFGIHYCFVDMLCDSEKILNVFVANRITSDPFLMFWM